LFTQRIRSRAQGLNICCRFNKGLAYGIHPVVERELQTGPVAFGKGAYPQVNTRQIQILILAWCFMPNSKYVRLING
jgi:hypothetical protein